MTLGEEIAERRERLGWSQAELAARASTPDLPVYQQAVQRLEKSTRTSKFRDAVLAALRAGERARDEGPSPEEGPPSVSVITENERYLKLPEAQLREALKLTARAAGASEATSDDLAQAGIELLSEPPIEALESDPLRSLRVQFELLTRRFSRRGSK